MASKATPGRSRPANTAYTPHRANQRSADSSPAFPTSTSTGTLPRAREIPKHTTAASTCPNRESIQPEHPESEPVGEGDEEGRNWRNQRLQHHKRTRGHRRPQTERDDVVSEPGDVSTTQDPQRPIRLGPELRRQEIQQTEHRRRRREQQDPQPAYRTGAQSRGLRQESPLLGPVHVIPPPGKKPCGARSPWKGDLVDLGSRVLLRDLAKRIARQLYGGCVHHLPVHAYRACGARLLVGCDDLLCPLHFPISR